LEKAVEKSGKISKILTDPRDEYTSKIRTLMQDRTSTEEERVPFIITRPQRIHKRRNSMHSSLQMEQIENPHVSDIPASAEDIDLGEVVSPEEIIRQEVIMESAMAGESLRRSPSGTLRRSTTGSKRRAPSGGLRRSPSGILRRAPSGSISISDEEESLKRTDSGHKRRASTHGKLTRVSGLHRFLNQPWVKSTRNYFKNLLKTLEPESYSSTLLVKEKLRRRQSSSVYTGRTGLMIAAGIVLLLLATILLYYLV